jgi:peptidoglycan-N-acetylglucosamine deacetylase
MLTFRRFTLVFFIILLGLNLWNIILGRSAGGFVQANSVFLYTALFIMYFGTSFALAFLPCSNFHHPVICRGLTDEKSVSITFDDGPDPAKTPIILELLKRYEVQATFFCIGKNIAGNEQLLKQVIEQGHLLGNHSYSHSKWFDLFTSGRMKAELLETDRLIKNVTGNSPLFFRPPFGVVNPMVSNALKNMHWQVVCWNIRSLDTLNMDPRKIRHKILRKLQPGAIILLHDFTTFSEQHLDELIIGIRDAGYRIVPLDTLLKMPAYAS